MIELIGKKPFGQQGSLEHSLLLLMPLQYPYPNQVVPPIDVTAISPIVYMYFYDRGDTLGVYLALNLS
jgi:hypothetical protein